MTCNKYLFTLGPGFPDNPTLPCAQIHKVTSIPVQSIDVAYRWVYYLITLTLSPVSPLGPGCPGIPKPGLPFNDRKNSVNTRGGNIPR